MGVRGLGDGRGYPGVWGSSFARYVSGFDTSSVTLRWFVCSDLIVASEMGLEDIASKETSGLTL